MKGPYFGKKTFSVVTGASRGIGHAIAMQLAENVGDDSTMVVTARSRQKLEQLRAELAQKRPGVRVVVRTSDLATADESEYAEMIDEALAGQKPADFQVAIVVHNAVTITDDIHKPFSERGTTEDLDANFHSNATAMICLNTTFLKRMAEVKDRLVVNMTSLAGVEPLPGSGIYSMTKAAREMYIRCLVTEDKTVRALNYAPGLVDTDLLRGAGERSPDFAKLLDAARAGKAPFKLLTGVQTASRLFEILAKDEYENGGHMDFEENWQDAYSDLLVMLRRQVK